MIPTRRCARLVAAVVASLLALPACAADVSPRLSSIRLPPGFRIEVYAEVEGARSLAVADEIGAVFVGSRKDEVRAIVDRDRDGRADQVVGVLGGLKVANGIAWKAGTLFVAEQHRVVRYDAGGIEGFRSAAPRMVFAALPDKGWHGWRYAKLGPDGRLYVAVGSPCNVCQPEGIEGTIVRLDPAGGPPEVFARGIRNSVGFDFQPRTGELYFTDNGADNMGDDSPPDEMNHAPRPGLHFGFPYYGGGGDRTSFLEGPRPPAEVTMPVVSFGAHVAALGVHFYRGRQFPAEYRGDAFVAQHGSWNRTVPDGYRIARVRFDEAGRATGWEPFAEGWLGDRGAWGRPVDIAELADGSLLVSDDRAGVVYRITYRP